MLTGYKTIIGAVAAFLTSVSMFLTNIAETGFQFQDLNILAAGISALFIAIGLGAKIERLLGKK